MSVFDFILLADTAFSIVLYYLLLEAFPWENVSDLFVFKNPWYPDNGDSCDVYMIFLFKFDSRTRYTLPFIIDDVTNDLVPIILDLSI